MARGDPREIARSRPKFSYGPALRTNWWRTLVYTRSDCHTHTGCDYVKRSDPLSFSSRGARREPRKREVRVLEREIARRDETRSVATRPPGKHDDRFLHPALPCPAQPNFSPRYSTPTDGLAETFPWRAFSFFLSSFFSSFLSRPFSISRPAAFEERVTGLIEL